MTSTILSFTAVVEGWDEHAPFGPAWVPEAAGSTVCWLQDAIDEARQVYGEVRVVGPHGETLDAGRYGLRLP